MLFNPSRPRTRAKRLSSTNLILIGGEILRGLSFCLVMILLASAIALTGTPSGVGASSNRLRPAASLDRIAPTTVYPFLPNVKVTDESSPYKYQVEPTMVINRSGTVFAGWKETDGPDAAGFRVGSSDSSDRVHFAYLEYDPGGGSSPPCNSGLDVSNTTNGQDWGTVHYIQGHGGLVDK